MKVSIGYTVGSSLSIFLILCISMNAHLVNGQIASIANATFAEDLSLLHVVVCFSNDSPTDGEVDIMTNRDVIVMSNQLRNAFTVSLSDMEVCQSKPIPVFIFSQNIGTELTITLASVAPVDVVNSTYSLQIPGPTLSFDSVMYHVLEGDINDNINVILRVCQTPITVSSTAGFSLRGSALAGRDYIQPTGPIIIQEQNSCTTLQIDIISDILAEEAETIIVQLQPVLPSRLSATSGTTTVTIFDDDNPMTINQPPAVQCPEDMFVTALPPSTPTAAQFDAPECVDNQQANFLATCTPSSGSSINVGSNIVNCTCTDSGGLAAYCTFIINVQMNQPPTVQCPADMSITAPLLSTSATVPFNTPQCLDNEQANFPATCSPSSGSSINVGSNTVTCSCIDSGGLAASCTFNITVQIDPCLIQPCNGNANCTSNEGLVKCTCREGFYGDGTTDGIGCTGCPRNVPDEKFGLNCSSPCTCASNADCNLVSGDCFGVECGDSKPQTCDKNNLNVMILQGDMDVDEKTAFTLNCTVNLGTADVTVTWSNPAGAEVQSGIVRRDLTSTLTVLNAGKEHSGTYTCIAWLKKPTETVTSRNDSVNINVRDFPEIDNLSLQEKSSSFLKFTWKVKDYGNDNITCRANYSEVENNKEMSQSCEETSCELSNLLPNTEYHFSVVCNNTAGPSNTLRMTSTTSSTGLVVALIVIVFIIILVVSIAVVVIFRRKSTQTDSAKRQSNKADVNYENEGLSRSTVYVNEQQTSNADALSYEPVQNQASGGIQLDKLPRTLPDSKVESSEDYEVTAFRKQNTALPEPPVSQDLDKVIYEDMPDELNYSHALYSQEKAPVPFKVSELPEYIHQRRLGGRNALEMEFMTLPQGQLEPWTEAVKKQNVYKGRNPDVLPYDSSRVKLVFDSINHSDYYNASFVMDQHNRHSFIAAESPSEDTADAFLWMIWQEKVDIVVMVSEMTDSAEQICSPYWPMKEGTSRHYGKMSVALKGIKNYPDYSVRELLIMKKGEDSISVTQFHYHSWPYRRVAEHPTSLLDFIKDVKLCLKRKHFPLLVHCSDGAGATGTFIGLFCLLDELTQSSEISIYHFVQKMRKTRINMVGTKAQYVFMYEVLLLAYQTPVTVYSANDYKKLVINKRKLSGQFQSLLKPKYQIDAQSGSATENKNRNRFSKIIPLDVSSPHLQCTSLLGGSGYINACFANSYFKKNSFILTQSPLPNTVEDFWRMVYDQKSTKIIMLNMLDSTDKTCNLYWPSGGNCQYGSVLVECTGTVTQDLYVCREMVVKHQDDEQVSVKLKHFQLLSWPEGKTAINVIRFIEAVGFSEGPEPVVVHCIDGVGHSGVYVTIHNEMQRFKDSDKVDIFQTVQSLRERNPHVFSMLKDFLFCYEALQAFVNKVA